MANLSGQNILQDNYALSRNTSERDRLHAQHQLVTEIFGGRLIFDKSVKLKPGDRILDSGTGAASWILCLRECAPENMEFVGVDVSTRMFPEDIPSDLELLEISSPKLPSEWESSFDFINQRLLVAAFTNEQWKTNLSELFRVLKPGGALELMEPGQFMSLDESNPLPATNRANEFLLAAIKKRNLLGHERTHQLPAFLEEAGFADISVEVHEFPVGRQWGDIGKKGSRNWISVLRTLGAVCTAEGGLDVCGSQEELDVVLEQVAREWDNNPGVFVQSFAISTRKPL